MPGPAAILGTIAAMAMGTAMIPAFAQASPQAMQPGDPGYRTVFEAATAPLRAEFGDRVAFDPERVDRIGGWVFVLGSMRAPGGGRPDFGGTRFADAAARGAMSDLYVALLRHEAGDGQGGPGGGDGDVPGAQGAGPDDAEAAAGAFPEGGDWTVLDFAIGPGDVAWLQWPQEHAAPRALFGF